MPWLSFFSSPITFAAVTVIAIGIIVYEIVNRNEERVPAESCRRGNPDCRILVPDSPSITAYKNSDSNIRHRKFEERETKSFTKSKVTKHGVDSKSSNGLKDAANEFDVKNYSKNVFDKIENDVRNINQRDERMKNFSKNIADDDSDSSENNYSTDSNEIKFVNTSNSETNLKDALQNFSGASSSRGVKVKRENIAGSQDTKQTNFDYRNAVASTAANNQQNCMKLCMACDEAFANAVAYPCKHCYLCIDCANMIHRIYDKCICNSVVEKFETLRM